MSAQQHGSRRRRQPHQGGLAGRQKMEVPRCPALEPRNAKVGNFTLPILGKITVPLTLLPVGYFHVVFTLPAEIADIAWQNKPVVYDLLFRAAADTMLTIAADSKHLGARVGITPVLHTLGSALSQSGTWQTDLAAIASEALTKNQLPPRIVAPVSAQASSLHAGPPASPSQ
jgi:hypothetical protein